MELQRFQRRVGVAGLRGTKWENCLHFFINFPGEHTQPILFSPKTDPKKLLAYEKKVPGKVCPTLTLNLKFLCSRYLSSNF